MHEDEIEFDWPDWVVDKIVQKHHVEPEEAEDCFFDPHRKIRKVEEGKYRLFGRAETGRYLFVVFAFKGRLVRVITARDMTESERRFYGRK